MEPGQKSCEETSGNCGQLFCDQKILSEGPLIVNPLRFAAETGSDRHVANFLKRIFITAFSPDGFAFQKLNRELSCIDIHRLAAHGAKVHLHAAILMIDCCLVLKLRNIEVGVEFSVEARQQVQIKGSSHAQLVVVSCDQLRAGLYQVSAKQ